jgi:glycosyltransferase involved in cell wall biosynthesis
VLRACALTTSDSQVMARCMRDLGAGEVMTFPFGLEALPLLPLPGHKPAHACFANRGLEAIYRPDLVLQCFARLAADWPDATLVVANDGSLRPALQLQAMALGLHDRIRFTGRLDAAAQAAEYARARWYISLPASDSVAVSVLEAMAHGCVPILSDLPANHELVRRNDNGWVLQGDALPAAADLQPLADRADAIGAANHGWVAEHALFPSAVSAFLDRLRALDAAASHGP